MYKLISFLKRNQTKAVILSFSVVFICCKGSQYLIPSDKDVSAGQKHWSGTTIASLNQGYSLYSTKCAECHSMKKPQDFSLDEWSDIMPAMGAKAQLDSNQYKLVYHYVLTKRETVLSGSK
jgi:hypothetical protein